MGNQKKESAVRQGIVWLLFLLCAYSAWLKGGVHPLLQWPLVLIAWIPAVLVLLLPRAQVKPIFRRVMRDPVFFFGGLFLCLLVVQWGNSGYEISASDASAVRPSVPAPSKWFPWSCDRVGASEMLIWFVPVFILLLVIRHVLSRSDVKKFIYLLALNSALLACIGIIQSLLKASRIFGIWDISRSDFFATFAYPNHAAAWFYLHAALAAGLAHDSDVKRKPRVRIVVWSICFLCSLVATVLTASRAGAIAATLLAGTAFVILCARVRSRLRGTRAINAYIALSLIPLLGLAVFFCAGGGRLSREMAGKPIYGQQSIMNDLAGRAGHVVIAGQMMSNAPLFGSGGRACAALAEAYVPEAEMRSWLVGGRANVHCDPAQFLVEFGIFGSVCMAAVVFLLARGALGALKRGILARWIGAGCLMVFLHSLIDLPFRCPAIQLSWCALLAALPALGRRNSRLNGMDSDKNRCHRQDRKRVDPGTG